MLAIIGGSGLTRLSTLAVAHREVVRTPYGEPSSALIFGRIAERDVVFLARHGHGHTIPPHRVNYRANLWALKHRGVDAIFAVASVGAIAGGYAPGDLVLPLQIIDYTSGRHNTFFDGGEREVVHVDFTHPYSTELRARCLAAPLAAIIVSRMSSSNAFNSGVPKCEIGFARSSSRGSPMRKISRIISLRLPVQSEVSPCPSPFQARPRSGRSKSLLRCHPVPPHD